jgi:hypothetical protein
MHIPTDLIVKELEQQGKSDKVQAIIAELPDKIDHDEHAALLQKHGIDPGKLAAKAAEKGLGSL